MARFKNGYLLKSVQTFASRSTNIIMNTSSKQINFVQATANITVTLPSAALGLLIEIANTGTGGFNLTVNGITIADNEARAFIASSGAWENMKSATSQLKSLFATFAADSGSTTASIATDTLNLTGGNYMTTEGLLGNVSRTKSLDADGAARRFEIKRDASGDIVYKACPVIGAYLKGSITPASVTGTTSKASLNLGSKVSKASTRTGTAEPPMGGMFVSRKSLVVKSKQVWYYNAGSLTSDSSIIPKAKFDLIANFGNGTAQSQSFKDTGFAFTWGKQSWNIITTGANTTTKTTTKTLTGLGTAKFSRDFKSQLTISAQLSSVKLSKCLFNTSGILSKAIVSVKHKDLKRDYMAQIGPPGV